MNKENNVPELKIKRTAVKREILYQGECYFLKGKREIVREAIVSKKKKSDVGIRKYPPFIKFFVSKLGQWRRCRSWLFILKVNH